MDTYHVVLYIHLLALFIGIGAASVLLACLLQLRRAQTLAEAGPWGMVAGKVSRLFPIAILGLFALSLDLILGYAGIVSLGHAAFFGFGAYAAGILAKYGIIKEPVLALLEPTELRLYRSESDIVRFAQAEGYLQFAENRALVLVEEAVPPDKLNRSDVESRLREAQQGAEQAEDGSEEQKRYERNVKRYEAFLEVVGSSS